MKKLSYFLLTSFIMACCTYNSFAQDDKSKRPSPPRTASGKVGELNIVVDYGAPSVKGRTIYGDLVPFGKVWRTGANEATTFSVNKDVAINGQPLPAGKYALFTIPQEGGEWTVIFNKKADQWGAYDYDQKDDVLRIKVKPDKTGSIQEQMAFNVNDSGNVEFSWEHLKFDFTVSAR